MNDISVKKPAKAIKFIQKLSEFVLLKKEVLEIDFPALDEPKQPREIISTLTPEELRKRLQKL